MKTIISASLSALVILSSCGKKTTSYLPDCSNDTIPILNEHQEFEKAVDSLVYLGLWKNKCFKGIAYVTEAKTGRIVAHTSLVKRGDATESDIDSYREIIENGLSKYIHINSFRKTKLTGVHDNVPIYSHHDIIGGDTIRIMGCCLYPEEIPIYEIFVALEKAGSPADAEKMCGPVIDSIISEITGEMMELLLDKGSVMESNTGVWGYFQSLCREEGAEVWTHGYTRDDSLDVWDAVALLHLYAAGKLDTYPCTELRKALRNMALEQAYRESHEGREYHGDNPGEVFMFNLLEKAAYYAPTISDIADTLTGDGKTGQIHFLDWTGMTDLYRFSIHEGPNGRFIVNKLNQEY